MIICVKCDKKGTYNFKARIILRDAFFHKSISSDLQLEIYNNFLCR